MSKLEQRPVRPEKAGLDAPEDPTEKSSVPPPEELLGVAARFAAAFALPGLAVYAVWNRLPTRLRVSTDIVGFPTWANFNIERYFWRYWLVIGFVPLTSLALYMLLTRFTVARPDHARAPRRLGIERDLPFASAQKAVVVSACRVAFVGAVLGLEAAIALARTSIPVVGPWIGVAVAYAVLAALVGFALESLLPRSSYWDRLAAVNALAAALTIGALYAVSATTEVRIASTGETKHYPWFPLWLAVPATCLVAVSIGLRLKRSPPTAFRAVERTALVFLVAPVFLFLAVAALPGAGGPVDMFQEGEALAAGNLTMHGAFPWRDLLFIHGLLLDVFPVMIGRAVFGDTRWGWMAATTLLFVPLCWVSLYVLCAYLFRRDWLFLAAVQAVIIAGVIELPMIRFLLLPVVFVLFALFLAKPTWLRAAFLTGLLVLQVIVAPEAALAAVALVVVVVAFDLYYLRRSMLLESFRRTTLFVVTGGTFVCLWFVFLASVGALPQFLGVFETFSSHHELTGGVPIKTYGAYYGFAAYTPVVVILAAFWYLVAKARLRLGLTPEDWTIAGATLFAAVYYEKFLARADHQWESFSVAAPVLFYVGFRLVGLAGRIGGSGSNRWVTPRHVATVTLTCLTLLLFAPNSLFDVIGKAPFQFSPAVAKAGRPDRLGYATSKALDPALIPDLRRLLGKELGPHDRLFDFTNTPALFYYFLDLRSPTRYYHVSMAIRQATQRDLIDELEHSRPKLVVFSSAMYGIPAWDAIENQVRTYDVSEYILRHYIPWASSHGFMFMRRIGARSPAVTPSLRHLYFQVPQCDWGYAPNFLTTRPPKAAGEGTPVSWGPTGAVSAGGWAVDESRKRPATAVVAAVGSRIVAQATPSVLRPDVAAALHSPRALRSGFVLDLASAVRRRGFDVAALRVYALFKHDRAVELGYLGGSGWEPSNAPPTVLDRADGAGVRVVGGPAPGTVESSKNLTAPILRLRLPPSARADDWLEIRARKRFRAGSFTLGDVTLAANRTIKFDTLPGSQKLFVQIGSCSQWYGLSLNHLFLQAPAPQEIGAIRLLH